jgi:hypothetical protein
VFVVPVLDALIVVHNPLLKVVEALLIHVSSQAAYRFTPCLNAAVMGVFVGVAVGVEVCVEVGVFVAVGSVYFMPL